MSSPDELAIDGWTRIPNGIDSGLREALRRSLFSDDVAGTRCLLDHPAVGVAAIRLRAALVQSSLLPAVAIAIQAIALDKTTTTNWKVTWHQDLMFPLASPATASDYEVSTMKDAIAYARPPQTVLERLLAVRLHLDDCDASNGPMRVSPGSHRCGILKGADIPEIVARCGEVACLAKEGEAILMRPLTLHASSPATAPKHRRVLHVVYHTGEAVAEPWHRTI